jgi:hypothetical protein
MFSPYFDLSIMDKYFIANVHDATPTNLKQIPNFFSHFFFWCLKTIHVKFCIKILNSGIYIYIYILIIKIFRTYFSDFFYHDMNFWLQIYV